MMQIFYYVGMAICGTIVSYSLSEMLKGGE